MTGNQRWRDRRATFRRPDEQIDTAAHDVAEIASDSIARAFVKAHHYSGSYPAARFRFGLYELGQLVGVAVFSHPARNAVITNVFPTLPIRACVELGRFVLLDRVAGNGETWFLARCFELLRTHPTKPIVGVVSFSDPLARTTLAGEIVMPGHVGTIYQAANARYLGRGRGDTISLLPDGRVLARRSYQKIRGGERGWRPMAELLVGYGADAIAETSSAEERCAWLEAAMAALTRPLRHPGNHRYAWIIDRRHRRALPVATGAYPKRLAT